MKKLLACSSMFASSLALAQGAVPVGDGLGQFWIEGKTMTLAYSNLNAPGGVTNAAMLELLADIEADIDGLNLPGLNVQVDTTVRSTGCGVVGQNTVVICWQPVVGNTGTFTNESGGSGTTYWREATVVLDTQTAWSSAAQVYGTAMHQLLHVIGFGHPEGSGTSVMNGALNLTQIDIDGLRQVYSATRCTLTYDMTTRNINIPYVTYRGNSYNATIHHNGGASFTLVGASMYSPTNPPLTGCQNIAVDLNNQVHLPNVNVNGAIYWGDLTLSNGSLTLTTSGIR